MKSILKSLLLVSGLICTQYAAADCQPTEITWGLFSVDGKTKQCKTNTFSIKEDQRATFFNSGQMVDGKRYVGSVKVICNAGRVIQLESSCKEGSDVAALDPISNSRITPDNFAPVVVENSNTGNAVGARLERRQGQADSINGLEDVPFSFELSSQKRMDAVIDQIDGAKTLGAIVGTGSNGAILSGFIPIDVKAVIIEVTARFAQADGSQFKYVDTVFCAPLCEDPIRTSAEVLKGGSSGHYWGYEQTSKSVKQINILAPAQTPFSVNLGQKHLLRDANVRLNFIPSDSPVAGDPSDFFPKTTAGLSSCAGLISVDDGSRPSQFTYTSTSQIEPLISDDPGCVKTPIINTGSNICRPQPRSGVIFCSGPDPTGNLALSIEQFICPPGTTKHRDDPVISCRRN